MPSKSLMLVGEESDRQREAIARWEKKKNSILWRRASRAACVTLDAYGGGGSNALDQSKTNHLMHFGLRPNKRPKPEVCDALPSFSAQGRNREHLFTSCEWDPE